MLCVYSYDLSTVHDAPLGEQNMMQHAYITQSYWVFMKFIRQGTRNTLCPH